MQASKEWKTCCFAGEQNVLETEKLKLANQLDRVLNGLIVSEGFRRFLIGAEAGFDLLAAQAVAKKKKDHSIFLAYILPCPDHTDYWKTPAAQAEIPLWKMLFHHADEIFYVSPFFYTGCEQKRNLYMLEHTDYCVFACKNRKNETGRLYQKALSNKKPLRNLYDFWEGETS